MSVLWLLAPAFFMCLLLTSIHCYLGLHVLARKIIFVDLALAQSAGFGLALSLLLGWPAGSLKSYAVTLCSALLAGGLFTLTTTNKKQPSQEAFIGIVYAFFSVLVILLLDKSSQGSELIKQTLTGHLVWATWADFIKILCIYSPIAVVYALFQKKLWDSSTGKNLHWKWNLLFYLLFSVVIASSVSVAGVLLVFSFLIVPSFLSHFLFQSFTKRLLFGWLLAWLLCICGLVGSYVFNLPTSAFIVSLFSFTAIVFVLISSCLKTPAVYTGLEPKKPHKMSPLF